MKSRIEYTSEPMGKVRSVKDFLPLPDQLAFKEEKIKVTVSLSRVVRQRKKLGRSKSIAYCAAPDLRRYICHQTNVIQF